MIFRTHRRFTLISAASLALTACALSPGPVMSPSSAVVALPGLAPGSAPVSSGACPYAMAAIPGGAFIIGSNDGKPDEARQRVVVEPFCMDVTEVTTNAYEACVVAGACAVASSDRGAAYRNSGKAGRGNHPINGVTWKDAKVYCEWAGKRLPTEEEWEYAARGSDGRKYPWGEAAPSEQLCWRGIEARLGTCAVGAFPGDKSAFGLLDMGGNVWEWTSSGYSIAYGHEASGVAKVARGGSWADRGAEHVRAANRRRLDPMFFFDSLGFRCAR